MQSTSKSNSNSLDKLTISHTHTHPHQALDRISSNILPTLIVLRGNTSFSSKMVKFLMNPVLLLFLTLTKITSNKVKLGVHAIIKLVFKKLQQQIPIVHAEKNSLKVLTILVSIQILLRCSHCFHVHALHWNTKNEIICLDNYHMPLLECDYVLEIDFQQSDW